MFSNPYFTNDQQQQFQQRTSVADEVYNKYKPKPSLTPDQLLLSIDDTSKDFSEHSLFVEDTNNKTYVHKSDWHLEGGGKCRQKILEWQSFSLQLKIILERVTFGQQGHPMMQMYSDEKLRLPSPIPQKKKEIFLESSSKSQAPQEEFYDEISQLKDRVIDMLKRYSTTLNHTENVKEVRQKIKGDASVIAKDYSQIIDKFNQSDISGFTQLSSSQSVIGQNFKREQELQNMCGLVEEFLNKFKQSTQVSFTDTVQQKINVIKQSQTQLEKANQKSGNASPQRYSNPTDILVKNEQKKKEFMLDAGETPLFKQFQSPPNTRFSEVVTIAPSNRFSEQVSTTRKENKAVTFMEQKPQKTNMDMTVVYQFPGMEDSFYQDKNQLSLYKINEKLSKLKHLLIKELEQDKMPYTKIILTEMIQSLNEIVDAKDQQLVRTIAFRIEQAIQNLHDKKEGSVDLYNYLSKALKHTKSKVFHTFEQRPSLPVLPTQTFQHNKYQERFTELTRPSQQQHLSQKRIFFDLALDKKNSLPFNHPGKNIMVSDLYDQFLEKKETDMEGFIKKGLFII